ncbi:MAG: chorismate-binding protein [Polaribacter sp.]
MSIIFDKINDFYSKNLPFVGYRKPNSDKVAAFFMNSDELYFTSKFTERGFVFAPFNSEEKAILFPKENAEFIKENIVFDDIFNLKDTSFVDKITDKESHLYLVEKALDEINKNEIKKVVVSRKEDVYFTDFELLTVFKKLLKTYKNAFVYVWFHPKVGLWFGATPETLLHISKDNFKTMSLAGTQVYENSEQVVWKPKELEEQQLVTDFIENQLKPIAVNLKIDKTETVKAGNLLHLRTRVEGKLKTNSNLKELIRSLHPTPAVCGLPREMAKNFINKNENYERTFYTGFLGEINVQDSEFNTQSSQFYVNLRCMRIEDKIASIYVGGGITKDSNAKKEWEETVSKSKTMKKVL